MFLPELYNSVQYSQLQIPVQGQERVLEQALVPAAHTPYNQMQRLERAPVLAAYTAQNGSHHQVMELVPAEM